MPTTLRIELDKLGFDWKKGTMLLQPGRGYESPGAAQKVRSTDRLIDQVFANGNVLDLPRFMASDHVANYVVYRNEHGSGLRKIYKESDPYLQRNETIPYPD